jgi:hypothetical protein
MKESQNENQNLGFHELHTSKRDMSKKNIKIILSR